MIGYMGQKVDGISFGQPPFLSVVALELARRSPAAAAIRSKNITIPFPDRDQRHGQGRRDTCSPTCPTASLPIHRFRAERDGQFCIDAALTEHRAAALEVNLPKAGEAADAAKHGSQP